eukprot:3995757-Karenia_brevis.AAC.1
MSPRGRSAGAAEPLSDTDHRMQGRSGKGMQRALPGTHRCAARSAQQASPQYCPTMGWSPISARPQSLQRSGASLLNK